VSASVSDETIIRYLLGSLPEDEQLTLEREVFSRDDLYLTVLALEDELVYRWLRAEFSAEEQRRFESRYFRYPVYREKAAFARALERILAARPSPRAAWFDRSRFRLPVLALASAGVAAVLFWQYFTLHGQILEAQRRGRTAENMLAENMLAERARAVRPPAEIVAAFTLSPGLTRGAGDLQRLLLPTAATALILELLLPPGTAAAPFQAVLRPAAGPVIWSAADQAPQAAGSRRTVSIRIPAMLLSPGEFDLALQTPELSVRYHFLLARPQAP
jgi:hypothetical protein